MTELKDCDHRRQSYDAGTWTCQDCEAASEGRSLVATLDERCPRWPWWALEIAHALRLVDLRKWPR